MGRIVRVDHLHGKRGGDRSEQEAKRFGFRWRYLLLKCGDERVLKIDGISDSVMFGVPFPERRLSFLKKLPSSTPMDGDTSRSDLRNDVAETLPDFIGRS